MKGAVLFFIGVLACIFLIAFLTASYFSLKQEKSVCFESFCFEVEIAKTPLELSQGLMFRKSLGQNKGMLFIFEKEGIYPFWMKNTLIPLDIIWIDENNKVVFISENTQPCPQKDCLQIIPQAEAKYVLELNAGQAREAKIKIGDLTRIL
ncbi:MAG: DUF192 domain-containing protein [Patescibacteria group bacterium]